MIILPLREKKEQEFEVMEYMEEEENLGMSLDFLDRLLTCNIVICSNLCSYCLLLCVIWIVYERYCDFENLRTN